jgi:hypothetical protein
VLDKMKSLDTAASAEVADVVDVVDDGDWSADAAAPEAG